MKIAYRILELTLIVALPVAILLAAVRAASYSAVGVNRLSFHLVVPGFHQAVLGTLTFLALYLAFSVALRRLVPRERWRGIVATAIPSLPVALYLALRINKDHLPGFWELESIAGNVLLASTYVVGCVALSIVLVRWERTLIGRSRPPGRHLLMLSLLAVNAAVIGTIYSGSVVAHREAGPNVILLLIDALRFDHLSSYGYERPTTPNIDRLARDSVLFSQAISPSTFTKTSISSLFTGLDPYRHGVYHGQRLDTTGRFTSDTLGTDYTTLAEAMNESGLLSVAWVENEQIRDFMGFDQGFARYNDHAGSIQEINEEVRRWLEDFADGCQFFAYIHYIDLHDPYRPKPPFDTLYGSYSDVYAGLEIHEFADWSKVIREVRDGERLLSASDVDQLKAYYDGLLTFIDQEIGRLLKELVATGRYDRTVIVVTSDHGDGFMEHGFISHATTPYDELIRVPLIVKFPDSRYAGRRVKRQVRLVDLAPTLLEIVGGSPLQGIDGVSLVGLLDKSNSPVGEPPTYAFVETADTVAIRTEHEKLIQHTDGTWEFYELDEDPRELRDLSGSNPLEAIALRALAEGALEQRHQSQSTAVHLGSKTIEKLKALGYIE